MRKGRRKQRTKATRRRHRRPEEGDDEGQKKKTTKVRRTRRQKSEEDDDKGQELRKEGKDLEKVLSYF
jgi:hypothetical protein